MTMAKGYINWKLAIVLVVATCVCVGAGLILHDWQKSTRADEALPLGQAAYEQGDWAEAATQLGRYLAVRGDDAEVLLMYGHAQRQIRPWMRNNFDQATSAYSAVLRSDEATAEEAYEATRWLVEIFLGTKRPGDAEPLARKYLENHDDPLLRRLLGLALWRQRKFQEAARTLRSLIEDHPEEIDAYDLLGWFAASRPSDFNEPPEYWYDRAVSQNPESALAHIIRGTFRRASKDLAGAQADFEKAASLDLSDTSVHLELIGQYITIRDLDKARAHLEMVKARTPKEPHLWRLWAKVAILSQSTEEMRDVAETGLKALAVQPWDFMLWATELFIRTDQFEKAKDCIVQMQKKDAPRARVCFLEGFLAVRQGRLREAVTSWEKAIALGYQSPDDPHWRNELPRVRIVLASILAQQGEISEAVAQLRTEVSENPRGIDAMLTLAHLLIGTEDWDGVLEQARQVKRLAPTRTEAVLLELNARVQLLGLSKDSAAAKAQAWRDIEDQLSELEAQGDYAVQAKLLRAQAAAAQDKYDQAGAILDGLEGQQQGELAAALLRAGLYVKEKKVDQAIALLEATIERFPQSPDLVLRLAALLDQQGKPSECESVIKAAMERIESPQVRRGFGLRLAGYYASWGQPERCYQWLMDLARQFPDDIATKRMVLDYVLNNAEQAQKIVDEIKAIEGDMGWQWRLEQARVWMVSPDFKSRYTDTVRLLQENLQRDPEDQASRVLLAKAYEGAGELDLALMIWREAIARSPENIQILVDAVNALYRAGENDEARQVLERAERADLHDLQLQALQAEGELRRKEWDSASDTLEEIIAQDPNHLAANLALARLYAEQQKYDEAHGLLDTLRAKDPNNLLIAEYKVTAFLTEGRVEEAMKLCNELVERLGSASAYLLRARTHAKLGQHIQALADMNQAVALAPDKADVWVTRADLLRTLNRVPEAVSDVRKALDLAPGNRTVQRLAARLFLDSGDAQLVQKSEGLIEQALKSAEDHPELKYLKARFLLTQRTRPAIEQAQALLKEITQGASASIEAWELRASMELFWFGNPSKAVDVLREAAAGYPGNRRLQFLKANAERQVDPNLAESTLKALVDREPNDVEAILALADLYLKLNREADALNLLKGPLTVLTGPARRACELKQAEALFRGGAVDQAVASFRRLVESDPNDAAPVLAWAEVLLDGQRWDQVAALVEDWTGKHPEDELISIMVAQALLSRGEQEAVRKAEDILRATLKSHPKSVRALRALANLTLTLGRHEESAAIGRAILEIDPNDVSALNNLAWLLCENQEQYQQAFELADAGAKIAPEYADIIDTRGVIHYRMGHYEEAVQDFTRCLELYPPTARALPLTRFHLARAFVALGRKTEAIQQLKQSLAAQEQQTPPPLSPDEEIEARGLIERLQKGS